jgi:hypothetical protein
MHDSTQATPYYPCVRSLRSENLTCDVPVDGRRSLPTLSRGNRPAWPDRHVLLSKEAQSSVRSLEKDADEWSAGAQVAGVRWCVT